jgi:hypothetical protein
MSILNFKVDDIVGGKLISVSYDSSITVRDFLLDFLILHVINQKKSITDNYPI